MALSKRNAVRALLVAVGLFVILCGFFPFVLFFPPAALAAWVLGGWIIWFAVRRR